jgi:sugar phosphate isomerase/epimerase
MQQPNSPLPRRRFLANVATAGAAATLLPLSMDEAQGKDPAPSERFKYAVCNELFLDWPFDKAFAFAAQCGYRGIEIAPFTMATYADKISAARRAEVRRQAKQAGLEVVGLHWLLAKTAGFHLTSSDAAVRRKTAEYFGQLARLCADLGGRIMVLGSPQQRNLAPGMTKEQGMKHAAEILRAAAPTLEKTGVVIAIEPLGPVETNFLATAAEGAELVALVDSATCRLHLDCKAMASEKTPIPELIHKYRKQFVHFHANDPNRQGPGFGKLDFVPIMKALTEIEYRGWVSVEPTDATPGIEHTARESIAYLRKCAARSG